MICESDHPVRIEMAMMEMRTLHGKMKMQAGQVLELHHLQNSNTMHRQTRVSPFHILGQSHQQQELLSTNYELKSKK